jgi:hypothetical protein
MAEGSFATKIEAKKFFGHLPKINSHTECLLVCDFLRSSGAVRCIPIYRDESSDQRVSPRRD